MPDIHQGGVVVTVPPHYPTLDKRETVTMLAAFGLKEDQIAAILKCTPDDIRRWYQNELDTGLVRINAQVKAALLHQALYKEDVAAMRLWLVNNAGWRTGDGPRGVLPPGDVPEGETVTVHERRTIIEQVLTRVTREKRDGERVIPDARVVATQPQAAKPNGANGAHKKPNGNGSGHT